MQRGDGAVGCPVMHITLTGSEPTLTLPCRCTRTPSLHNLGQTRTHEQLSYRDTMRLSPGPAGSVASHCINRQTPVGGPIQLSGLLHEIINRTCVASSSARLHPRAHLGAVQSAQTWFVRVRSAYKCLLGVGGDDGRTRLRPVDSARAPASVCVCVCVCVCKTCRSPAFAFVVTCASVVSAPRPGEHLSASSCRLGLAQRGLLPVQGTGHVWWMFSTVRDEPASIRVPNGPRGSPETLRRGSPNLMVSFHFIVISICHDVWRVILWE